ncbi:lipase member I [Stomoxys calcitrans]|uniref:lipase member I n=1 Tax=Stomoxys calcitrans TaxID=35570 RepID=UPI0027E21C9B|nr:lipase member I [Stomoxys calcitrans]
MRLSWRVLLNLSLLALCQAASVEEIQLKNIDILTDSFHKGWKEFCDAPVDEGVMSLYNGINPSDTSIHLLTINNQSVELPIRALSEIRDFDINPQRKTLLYVNGFYTADSYFSVQAHLHMMQARRRDLNVIVVNFAKDIQQLYYALRHHLTLHGYFIAKILSVLVENGVDPEDITLAGHSVGANAAALGASLYTAEYWHSHRKISLIDQLIAIDPASHICDTSDLFVRNNVTSRVVVIHGEGNIFGVREPLGTIDIYPNGVGFYPKRKLQPGCESWTCSHMYPFLLFMEALVEGVSIPSVRCENWMQFKDGLCNYQDIVEIGITYPAAAKGLYFCVTQPHPPFTLHENGFEYRSRNSIFRQ